MGDWSSQPWGSDEATDWFHRFWASKDVALVRHTLTHFDATTEHFDSVRAACYLLQVLGTPYTWPASDLPHLKATLLQGIALLERMLGPGPDGAGFRDQCAHDPAVMSSVQQQLEALRERAAAIKAMR